MATYIPGSSDYIPQLQTFTPNYKFLQDVLEVRQDRYTTNYNLLNDLWGDVVYADLGREDNRQVRDQYANQLSEKMKQVSGMDLSLQQNVEAAKGLFKPFYENKNIVGDIARTKQYQKEKQKMNAFYNSTQEFQRKKWWQTGSKYLDYLYQDFIEADPKQSLSKPFPTYIENPNVIDRAIELLKEKGLSIERTTIEGDYFLTETNGNLLLNQIDSYDPETDTYTTRSPAKAMLKNLLLQDPLIMRAYAAEAEVKAREFAEDPVNLQKYGSKEAAMAGWAKDVMGISLNQQTTEIAETNTFIEQMANNAEMWDEYQKKYKLSPAEIEVYNKKINDLKMLREANKTAEKSVVNQKGPASTQNQLMSKAYESYMRMIIDDKLTEAAKEYADLGAKTEIKHDPMALARNKHNYNMARDYQKHLYTLLEIEARNSYKNRSSGTGSTGDGFDLMNPNGVTVFTAETEGGELDKSILDGTGYFEYVDNYFNDEETKLNQMKWAYIEESFLGSNSVKNDYNHTSNNPDVIDNTKFAYTIEGKEYFTDLNTAKTNLLASNGESELERIFSQIMKKRQSLEINNGNNPVPEDVITALDPTMQKWMADMEEQIQDQEAVVNEGVQRYYDIMQDANVTLFNTDPGWKQDNDKYQFPHLAMPEGVIKLLMNEEFGLLMDDPTETKANVSWKEFLKYPKKYGLDDLDLDVDDILATPVRRLSKDEWVQIYVNQAKGGKFFGEYLNNSPETKDPNGMNGTRGDHYPNARKERDEIPELSGIRGEFWKLNKNYELFPPPGQYGVNFLMDAYADQLNKSMGNEDAIEYQRSLIGYYQFNEEAARNAAEADWEALNERMNSALTSGAAGGKTGYPTFDPIAYFSGVSQEGSGLITPKTYQVDFRAVDNNNPQALNEMSNILRNLVEHGDEVVVGFGDNLTKFPEASDPIAKEILLDLIAKHKTANKDKTKGRLDYSIRYVESLLNEDAMEANKENNGYAGYVIDFGDDYAANAYLGANKLLNSNAKNPNKTQRDEFMSGGNTIKVFMPKQHDNSVFKSSNNSPASWEIRLQANGSIENIIQNGGKYKLFQNSNGEKMVEITPMYYNETSGNIEWQTPFIERVGIDDYNVKALLKKYNDRLGMVADNNIKNKNQSSKVVTDEQEQGRFTIDMFPGLPANRLQWAIGMTKRGYVWDPSRGTMVKPASQQ